MRLIHQCFKLFKMQQASQFILFPFNKSYNLQMKSLLRNIVAGPKKKTPYNGQQLDLTYITDRVIAMAYPASNFLEKAYRNSITDVANYLNQYHKNNYLIFNVSSRPYDYTKFNNQVLQYEWPDHQAPPLTTLFEIAYRAYQYLKSNSEAVVAVHCNHGKGRTGTAIISILLYLGLFKDAQQALNFYNSRRFSSETYGVDQPCQTRYLNFVQEILATPTIPYKLIAFRLCNVSSSGLHQKHFVSIKQVRTNQTLVQKFNFSFHQDITGSPLIGDLFIEIHQEHWSASKQIARINYNTYLLDTDTEHTMKSLKKDEISVLFKGSHISCKKTGQERNFNLTLCFEYFCLCHIKGSEGVQCQCQAFRKPQQRHWRKMVDQKIAAQNVSKKERANFLSAPFEHAQKQIKQQQSEQFQNVYELGKHLSNLDEQEKVIGRIKESSNMMYENQGWQLVQFQLQSKKQELKNLSNSTSPNMLFSKTKDKKL